MKEKYDGWMIKCFLVSGRGKPFFIMGFFESTKIKLIERYSEHFGNPQLWGDMVRRKILKAVKVRLVEIGD